MGEADPRARGPWLLEQLPELAVVFPGLGPVVLAGDRGEVRARLLDALCDLSCGAATRVPLVLVIEDVHWIDDASLQVVTALARQVRRSSFLLLLTYRSDEVSAELHHASVELERRRLEACEPPSRPWA